MNIFKKRGFKPLPTRKTPPYCSRVPDVFLVFLLAVCLLLGVAAAHGSEEKEPEETPEEIKLQQLVVPSLTGEATIDAVLDEPFWQQAAIMELKREVFPTPLAPATVKTEARIARLQDYLLISFVAQDPEPDRIQAPWRDRDGIDMDDYVSFVLDPAGKNITNYELKVSASGIKGDQIRNRVNDQWIRDWNPKWQAAARIVPEGYIVEMRIPLAEFDFPMHEGVKRLIAFKRHYPREVRRILGALAVVAVKEEVPGLEKNLMIIPSATFEYERERPATGTDSKWEATEDPTVSLDIAYKPTPSLTLLGTVNPNYL
ncbi:MAG: carbohydrate binding family 9 domain-containing protein, partial [Desulfobulbales bacterium]